MGENLAARTQAWTFGLEQQFKSIRDGVAWRESFTRCLVFFSPITRRRSLGQTMSGYKAAPN